MGLCLQTSKWSDTLWRSHLAHSSTARQLVTSGAKRQPQFPSWATDLHGLLYLRQPPEAVPGAPPWATDLLQQAQDLAEWKPLKARCMQSGFAAGVATEHLLRGLADLVPQQPTEGAQDDAQDDGTAPDPGRARRGLRQALRAAGQAVDEAEAAMEGLREPFGLGCGHEPGTEDTLVRLEHVRSLYEHLATNDLLRHIAQLAGRLERLAASQKRSRALSHVGAITGVTIGGDLPRLLPSELAGLRSGRFTRLQTLGKILGRRALQYAVHGEVPETRGPILCLLDESGSMHGPRLVWSKAVALALLTVCRQQQRAWGLIGFDEVVQRELVVEPGAQDNTTEVMQVLLGFSGGGTNFDAPLVRALAVLQASPVLRKADLIFITDGASAVSDAVAAQVNALRAEAGLSVYVIGLGRAAALASLQPIATATYHLSAHPQDQADALVPLLTQVA